MLKKIKISENSKSIIYKLANDIALVLIVSLILALLLETVLPGMVSGRRGFEIIIFPLVADVILVSYLSRELGIHFKNTKKKKAIYGLLFVCLLIVASSLIKFGMLLMVPIIIASLVTFYFLYLIFFKVY